MMNVEYNAFRWQSCITLKESSYGDSLSRMYLFVVEIMGLEPIPARWQPCKPDLVSPPRRNLYQMKMKSL